MELVSPSPTFGAMRMRVTGLSAGAPMPDAVLLFDVRGARVRRVPIASQGHSQGLAAWDGKDETGRIAPAGLYFARLPGTLDVAGLRFVRLR